MAYHSCVLKDRRSNDAVFLHATPHVNLWHIPPVFDNFLKWLTTLIFTVMSVHVNIQMESCLSRETHPFHKNLITDNFVQHFYTKLLSTVMIV
jgi:hypothetical protein